MLIAIRFSKSLKLNYCLLAAQENPRLAAVWGTSCTHSKAAPCKTGSAGYYYKKQKQNKKTRHFPHSSVKGVNGSSAARVFSLCGEALFADCRVERGMQSSTDAEDCRTVTFFFFFLFKRMMSVRALLVQFAQFTRRQRGCPLR